jgi:hypothetical protein
MSVFMIRIFTIIVRFFFPHAINWFFISSFFFSELNFWHSSLLCPKNIPNALTAVCVHLIPPILSLQFFSLPIHIFFMFYFFLELTLKMTQIPLFHSWLKLYQFWNSPPVFSGFVLLDL